MVGSRGFFAVVGVATLLSSAAAEEQGTTVEALAQGIARNIPLGRIPDDAECAKAALFLVSDYARAVTGAALDVNGGEFLPR